MTPPPPSPRGPLFGLNLTRLIIIAVLIALLAAFYFSGLNKYLSWDSIKERRNSWREVVDLNREAAMVLFLALSVVLMSVSLPVGSILSIAAGALFDLWWGVALITVASSIGSSLAFVISRYLLRDFVRYWFARWFAIVDRGIERDGSRYLLMLRLSPVVPFFAVNAVMGLTNMRLRTFIPVTFIGMLPSCFLYVMVGTQIRRIDSPEDIISWELIVLLTLLALTPLLFGWVMRRVRKPSPVDAQAPVESEA
jgi:uncharacterized membrane protein YdjX (TVP38/TMEM64 family)